MRFLLAALAVASAVSATQYTIGVGKDETTGYGGYPGFDPSRTQISDPESANQIVFEFLGGVHRVVQSTFDSPCSFSVPGGFDSGLQTVANGTLEGNGPSATFTIANNSEVAYFSDIGDDNTPCWQGAVFCLNTDESSAKSCAAFKTAALALGQDEDVATPTHATAMMTASSTSTPSSTLISGSGNANAVSTSSAPHSSATTKASGVNKREISVLGALGATLVGFVFAIA
ncbi:hypothetical protein JCM1841_000410 [Sporobolomyces salmonicolor]